MVIGCLGLAAAAVLHRRGQPTAGWLACAVTGVLLSPISWDNHWVWIVPMLGLLTHTATRARHAARVAWWAVAAAAAAVYLAWPAQLSGPRAFVPHGLLGFSFGPHSLAEIFHLHGFQLISWNVYVLPGLGMLALLVTWAVIAWRRGPVRVPPPVVPRAARASASEVTGAAAGRRVHAAADSQPSSGGQQ